MAVCVGDTHDLDTGPAPAAFLGLSPGGRDANVQESGRPLRACPRMSAHVRACPRMSAHPYLKLLKLRPGPLSATWKPTQRRSWLRPAKQPLSYRRPIRTYLPRDHGRICSCSGGAPGMRKCALQCRRPANCCCQRFPPSLDSHWWCPTTKRSFCSALSMVLM